MSGLSYEDAIDAVVSRDEARFEIQGHNGEGSCDLHGIGGHGRNVWAAFVCDLGDHATYLGADVLAWLGY